MIERRGEQQLARGADAPARRVGAGRPRWRAGDERHHRDAGLEAAHAERELGEDDRRGEQERRPVAAQRAGRPCQRSSSSGCAQDLAQRRAAEHDEVEQRGREWRRATATPIASRKPLQEDEPRAAPAGRASRSIRASPSDGCEERVLDRVLRGVGGRERHRDDEVGRREAEQHEDEELARASRAAGSRASRSSPGRRRSARATCA